MSGRVHAEAQAAPKYSFVPVRTGLLAGFHGKELVSQPPLIQAKLTINQPNDQYEQEADRVADEVMRMPEPEMQWQVELEEEENELIQTKLLAKNITPLVQRQIEEEEEELIEELKEEKGVIMTKALSNGSLQVTDSFRARLNRSKCGGQKLAETDRNFMERRFDVDFSNVRIHTDSNATQMSRNLSAQAFTHGRDIYFGAGRYTPGTSSGNRLIAHELTHVVQQAGGNQLHQSLEENEVCEEQPNIWQFGNPFERATGSENLPIQIQTRAPTTDFLQRTPIRIEDPDVGVYAFLLQTRDRFPSLLEGVVTGRISGNILEFGERNYLLLPTPVLQEGQTVSLRLGEGVFFLRPTSAGGAIRALAGGAYEIVGVNAGGNLEPTNLQVRTGGLVSISEGILVYSASIRHIAEERISVRPPRDTEALAEQIIERLSGAGRITAPGIVASQILQLLSRARLNNDEMMDILQRLETAGQIGRFLEFVRFPWFRQFLRARGVSWMYIFMNWEASINDCGAIFAGFILGAGESWVDVARLIGVLVGSVWSRELEEQIDQFFRAIAQFFEHPITNTVRAVQEGYESFVNHLWNLELFEAGRILGQIGIVVLTLPTAIRSIPRLAQAVARFTVEGMAHTLGIARSVLRRFALDPSATRLVTTEGYVLMASGDDIVAIGQGGRAGRISRQTLLQQTNEATGGGAHRGGGRGRTAERGRTSPETEQGPGERPRTGREEPTLPEQIVESSVPEGAAYGAARRGRASRLAAQLDEAAYQALIPIRRSLPLESQLLLEYNDVAAKLIRQQRPGQRSLNLGVLTSRERAVLEDVFPDTEDLTELTLTDVRRARRQLGEQYEELLVREEAGGVVAPGVAVAGGHVPGPQLLEGLGHVRRQGGFELDGGDTGGGAHGEDVADAVGKARVGQDAADGGGQVVDFAEAGGVQGDGVGVDHGKPFLLRRKHGVRQTGAMTIPTSPCPGSRPRERPSRPVRDG